MPFPDYPGKIGRTGRPGARISWILDPVTTGGNIRKNSKNTPLALTDEDHLVKNGDMLGLWNPVLNIDQEKVFHGIFWKGMRYISRWTIRFGHSDLLPLTSAPGGRTQHSDPGSPYCSHAHLLGPHLRELIRSETGRTFNIDGPLLIERIRFCGPSGITEEVTVYNHAPSEISVPLTFEFDADFRDMMEVRGIRVNKIPNSVTRTISPDNQEILLESTGIDRIVRKTRIRINDVTPRWTGGRGEARFVVPPLGCRTFTVSVTCLESPLSRRQSSRVLRQHKGLTVDAHLRKDRIQAKNFRNQWPSISGEGSPLDKWSHYAIDDLRVLLTPTRYGPFPYAGIPWFATPFGRDSLITGFSTLWAFPSLTRSVLLRLASLQARKTDPFRDAEPGKILHEFRYGEAAKDPGIPFGLYYGSVDSTPLFVALCRAYLDRTGETDLLLRLKPQIFRAMEWIEKWGVHPETGFLVYTGDRAGGLVQKGWKDSGDSVFHSDGRLAKHPVALSEVQGYLFMAYEAFSRLLDLYGEPSLSRSFHSRAKRLKQRFNDFFWSERIGMFSMALDGNLKPCEVRTSNAGQVLFSGIADQDLARKTSRRLLEKDLFSGWGIRTLGTNEIRYNPVSYHNGSVWPHDNAMIMAGMARHGCSRELSTLAESYLQSLSRLPSERPPELYCGFGRSPGEGPLSYPTSCRIQAWSVASFFMTIQSIAHLGVDGLPTPHFEEAILPGCIDSLNIKNISGTKRADSMGNLEIRKKGDDTLRAFWENISGET